MLFSTILVFLNSITGYVNYTNTQTSQDYSTPINIINSFQVSENVANYSIEGTPSYIENISYVFSITDEDNFVKIDIGGIHTSYVTITSYYNYSNIYVRIHLRTSTNQYQQDKFCYIPLTEAATQTFQTGNYDYISSFDFVTMDIETYQSLITHGYDTGHTDGYIEGYSTGLAEGMSTGHITEIFTNILNVGVLPINVLLSMLNFEVFGINIGGFVTGLLTIAMILILTRTIFNGGSGGKE